MYCRAIRKKEIYYKDDGKIDELWSGLRLVIDKAKSLWIEGYEYEAASYAVVR